MSFIELRVRAVDRRTKIRQRLSVDDIAIIDHTDLTRLGRSAPGIRGVVVNVAPSQSGRFQTRARSPSCAEAFA
jgi:uncharacterized membrane-anchored protein